MNLPSALIVNGRSRRGRAWFSGVREKLEAVGIHPQRVVLVRNGMDLGQEIDWAVENGCQAILVGGGDGSLRIAAQRLAGSNTVLGALPFGTGNAFARDLGIETDLTAAVETLREGNILEVDVGKGGNHCFLNVASVGLSSLVASRLRRWPKTILGPLAYAFPFLQSIRFVRPFRARLTFEDDTEDLHAYQIVIGNGRYHAGPFLLAQNAGLQTGRFVVYALLAGNRTVLYRYALAMLLGRQQHLPELKFWEASRLELATAPKKTLVMDGEMLGRTPIEFQVIPRALRVFAPKNDPKP